MCDVHLSGPTAPITALAFVGKSVLLAGEGPYLHVYDAESSRKMLSTNVLCTSNIHGIRTLEATSSEGTGEGSAIICVFGSKMARVVEYSGNGKGLGLRFNKHEFEDWIWDVCPLSEMQMVPASRHNMTTAAVALSHNSVLHWNYETDEILQDVHCEEKCILYSARLIGYSWQGLVLAAGTVFNQVVLWRVSGQTNEKGRIKVMHRLHGHQGVIFSIVYHAGKRQICSVSDDRSIRIWQHTVPTAQLAPGNCGVFELEHAVFHPLHVLYGHSARVWDVKLLNDCLVSIGEDATTCIWSHQGKVIQKFKGHKGKSIWSVAVNANETLVATGGGDTSIRLWPLGQKSQTQSEVVTSILQLPTQSSDGVEDDFPRIVKLQNESTVLTMTNAGCLWSYAVLTQQWTLMWHKAQYQSYSLLAVSDASGQIAVANISGSVLFQSAAGCIMEWKLYEGKVFSMQWLSDKQLLTTGSDGSLDVWQLDMNESSLSVFRLHHYVLPYTRQRWVSAAMLLYDEGMLVCGDRGGTVHVYDVTSQDLSPVQSFVKLHGKAGVTDLCYHDDHLYTCGRNGLYCRFAVDNGKVHLLTSDKFWLQVFKGFDWIAKLMFMDESLYILGFHNEQFLVYNIDSNQVVFSTHCGGGHRAWDVTMKMTCGLCRFVSIKTRDIRLCEGTLFTGHTTLKPSLHGRELSHVTHLFSGMQGTLGRHILATSGEDTLVNLVSFSTYGESMSRSTEFKVIKTLHGHISSVRALAVSEASQALPSQSDIRCTCQSSWMPQSKLLFSGGGRAQLKAWQVHFELDPSKESSCGPVCQSQEDFDFTPESQTQDCGVWCKHLSTHMLCTKGLKRRKPWKSHLYNASPETRYMALTAFCLSQFDPELPQELHVIAAACSDGFVRVFTFSEASSMFHLVAHAEYHRHCVLGVSHLLVGEPGHCQRALILSAATDGSVAFWDVTYLLEQLHVAGKSDTRSKTDSACEDDCDETSSSEPMCDIDPSCGSIAHCTSSDITDVKQDAVPMAMVEMKPPVTVLKVHQSGVNSLSLFHLGESRYLLGTGGDDNTVCVAELSVTTACDQMSTDITEVRRVVCQSAHAAQITGLHILSAETLVSVSIDQRLTMWKLEWGKQHASQLTMASRKFVNVADTACLAHWQTRSDSVVHHLALCGIGLQHATVGPGCDSSDTQCGGGKQQTDGHFIS